ncbi:MAG: protein kinase [Kofleriaceae bacterium]
MRASIVANVLGETIGNFKIVAKLGRGGMGEVWLGEQQSLGTRVAIKTLLEAFPRESEDVQRFFNEARAVSRIQHAGITKIFDSGILPNGRAYLVMEYLDGESLAQRITRGVSRAALAEIGRQIASVLDATHGAGITHRDLKPENVFLIADREQPRGERVKVLDFGVAKLTGTLAPGSPRTYGTLGTPMYMAPEQWGDASQVDWRADLYSLGCVTFEMACRRPPFPVKSVAEACAKHLHDTPVLASSLVDGIPPALDQLIARLLAKQPEQRPRSMREVEHAFEQIGRAIGVDGTAETLPFRALPPNADVLATMTAGEASGHPPQTQPARRRTVLVAGIVATVVSAGAAATVYVATRTHTSPAVVQQVAVPTVTTIAIDAAVEPSSHDQTLAAIVQAANTGDGEKPPTEQATHHRVATTAPATPAAPATIDRDGVRAALVAHREAFQLCNAHHDTMAKLTLTFTIGLDGRASRITAIGADDELAACATAVVREISFPKPKGGTVDEQLPMTFEALPDPVRVPPPAELPQAPDQDAVKRGLLAAENALDHCMVVNHVEDRQLLEITIDPTGHVTTARAQGPLAESAYSTCVLSTMHSVQFPASKTGLKLTVPVTPP